MSDRKEDRPIGIGIFDTPASPGPGLPELLAGLFTVIWAAGAASLFAFGMMPSPESAAMSQVILMAIAVGLPIAIVWILALIARSMVVIRSETDSLRDAITTLRQAYLEQSQANGQHLRDKMERKIADLVDAQRQTESAIATFATRRDQVDATSLDKPALMREPEIQPPPQAEGQATLALATPAEALREPISVADFITAANFPETPDDRDGFRALRLALEDPDASKLIRSAQDILTLLSQDGVYMDDLRPDRARPEVWRRFAQGERGKVVAALGGIRDRSCLALTTARIKSDPVFRDAVHHFLRQFDRTLMDFESHATDEELSKLGETRSARAFMLLGRVTGMFD